MILNVICGIIVFGGTGFVLILFVVYLATSPRQTAEERRFFKEAEQLRNQLARKYRESQRQK